MIIQNKVIHGYKAFASDGTNIALETMPVGVYYFNGPIKYGKFGYHFAKNLEDTIRYSGTTSPVIAEVIGSGTIDEGTDEYYGFYDIYAASNLKIVRYLTRDEIIEYALNLKYDRLKRFVVSYELTNEELDLFIKKDNTIEKVLEYYQIRENIKIKKMKK